MGARKKTAPSASPAAEEQAPTPRSKVAKPPAAPDPELQHCPECGGVLPEHLGWCELHLEAEAAGVTLYDYMRTPSLWCLLISGFRGSESHCVRIRHHAGHHGFPTEARAIEAHTIVGAAALATEWLKPVVLRPLATYSGGEGPRQGPREPRAPRQPRAPGAPRTTRGTAPAGLASKRIHLLKEGNQRREGTEAFKRYAVYREGMTVAEFLTEGASVGCNVGNVLKDQERGNISLID